MLVISNVCISFRVYVALSYEKEGNICKSLMLKCSMIDKILKETKKLEIYCKLLNDMICKKIN